MWSRLPKLAAHCGPWMILGLCCTTALWAQRTSPWASYDSAHKVATVRLESGAPGSSGPFSFDAYTGGATLVVPPGCAVMINFVNDDGTPHSAEVIADKDPMPDTGGDPAIPGAYTRDVTRGLPQGATDVMRFTAPSSSSYRIFCGVSGHGLSGMWIRFKVDPADRAPTPVDG